MKYLGLTLDSRWHFGPHFAGLSSRLLKAADTLSWLLPNLGGPRTGCRKLYAGILRSMALYGAPIWVESLRRKGNATHLRRPQRAIAQRVARCYRTVAFGAACALACTPPWELEAEVQTRVYTWSEEKRALGVRPTQEERGMVQREARDQLVLTWREVLAACPSGRRVLDALEPVLDRWLERPPSMFVTYRLVQVLSGHGCFRKYLHRIGLEKTPSCPHCGAAEDTTEHTLSMCPAWSSQRANLVALLGSNLSFPSMVEAMLGSEEAWTAVVFFCEDVMLQKEVAERERENDPSAPLCRKKRLGRARRIYSRLIPHPGDQRVAGPGAPSPALHRSPPTDGFGQVCPTAPVTPSHAGGVFGPAV